MTKKNKTAAVAMSGGVDSSLAAALLREQGYDVVGLTMAVYAGGGTCSLAQGHACYGPDEADDIAAAGKVADFLCIPHHVIDVRQEYKDAVLDYVTAEYLAGKTPNPCVRCNPVVKFGFLMNKARSAGIAFDFFATGHYVRVCYDEARQRHVLRKGIDGRKDQSYFLYGLSPELLPRLLFPLGSLTKQEVRTRAHAMGLPVSARQESQDFMAGSYAHLFQDHQVQPGPILDEQDNQLGTHKGIIHYTIGQRKGLGIARREPLYVLGIDPERNAVIVGPQERLFSRTLIAGGLHLLACSGLESALKIKARIRSNHTESSALLEPLADTTVRVTFDEPQLAITPGQAVVFYDDDVVLGGGTIIERCS